MKVLLELLEDTANVLSNLDAIDQLRPQSRAKLVELLEELTDEGTRLLAEAGSIDEGDDMIEGPGREEMLERGLAAIARDQLDEAKAILSDGVESYPDDVEMLTHLGLTCWENGDLEEAEGWYADAMEAGLARVRRSSGNSCASPPAEYLRAIEGRALCLYKLGSFERAVELFESLGMIAPGEYAGCHYLAGEILHLQGRPEEAVDAYRRSPDEPSVHYNLGLAYFQIGDREKAARTLIRGFSANPHIAHRLLDRDASSVSGPGGYLGSATYAEEFIEACTPLWAGADEALEFVDRCFEHPLVRDYLDSSKRSEGASRPEQGGRARNAAKRRTDETDVDGLARRLIERLD